MNEQLASVLIALAGRFPTVGFLLGAEKCLKAWIAAGGNSYPRTHDLMALIETLNDEGEDTSSLNSLVDLNPFAVQYRYESLDSDDDEFESTLQLSVTQHSS